MNVKSKFNLRDTCWIMLHNKPTKLSINGIYITIDDLNINVKYTIGPIDSSIEVNEEKIYSTREELLKSL